MQAEPTLARIFLPDGRAPRVGERHRQPELARTLQAIADGGRAAFYEGEIARDMVDYLRGLGGLHTMEDFASVKGDYVPPISAEFRGYRVWECPPNGQGVIALLLLNIMAEVETGSRPITVARMHAEIEACRLAYAARTQYLCDPDFGEMDVEALLSPDYADRLRSQIDPRAGGASDARARDTSGTTTRSTSASSTRTGTPARSSTRCSTAGAPACARRNRASSSPTAARASAWTRPCRTASSPASGRCTPSSPAWSARATGR